MNIKNLKWDKLYGAMSRSATKYAYFEGSYDYDDVESSRASRSLKKTRVDWGARAVDIRANKMRFDRFDNDTIGLNEVFDKYKGRQALEKLYEDILICGVGFLALSGSRVLPFTAEEATGTFSWKDQNLSDGVAVYRRKTKSTSIINQPPDSYVVYTKEATITVTGDEVEEVQNVTGRPLIGMFTRKSTTRQPFGRTVLVQAAREAMQDGSRIHRQAMIAAHHYNTKVDVIMGVDNETEVEKIEARTGDILKIGTNDNGQIPQLGQFAQHAMAPFNDSLMMAARNFCASTKLRLDNLALSTSGAPQSPETLEIVGDDLRDDILKWQEDLGEQMKYFAVTLMMYDQGLSEISPELQEKIDAISVSWMPVFRPDISKFGDGLNKMAANAPGIVSQRSIWRRAGLRSHEIEEVIASVSQVDDL